MFFSFLCLLCFCVRLFICALWSPAGKELVSRLCCLTVTCHFPICILGQMWYLIVSILDLCTLTYFLKGIEAILKYFSKPQYMQTFNILASPQAQNKAQ